MFLALYRDWNSEWCHKNSTYMKRLKVSMGGKFQKEAICERCKRRYVDRSPIVSLEIKLTSCFTFDFSGTLYCILYEDIKYTVFLLCFDVSSVLLFS